MATIFIFVVLVTLATNSIIMRSKTQWWRDPGSLFRGADESPEPVTQGPVVQGPVVPGPTVESRRAVADPRELAPRRSAEVRAETEAGTGTGTPERHAVREDEAVTQVFARVRPDAADDHAPTELLARVPADPFESGRPR
jgi:hypothetical protein